MILLDRSIAMGERFEGGTKFEAALAVLNEGVLQRPDMNLANLALRQYGGSCEQNSTQLLVNFGQGNQDRVRTELDDIRVDGQATLVRGIAEAAADFSKSDG